MRGIYLAGLLAACAGADGADGADGEDGADGTDNHITDTYFCGGALESTPYGFTYSVALMSAGDIFSYGALETSGQSYGASAYFAEGQVGAATAPVIFTADASGAVNGGWWQISLNRTSLVTTIVYNDTDVAGGQSTWTMLPATCVVNSF